MDKRYQSFAHSCKKTEKKKNKIRYSLIYLLGKLYGQLDQIEKQAKDKLHLNEFYHKNRTGSTKTDASHGEVPPG